MRGTEGTLPRTNRAAVPAPMLKHRRPDRRATSREPRERYRVEGSSAQRSVIATRLELAVESAARLVWALDRQTTGAEDS
jgi:hypothetical protein